MKRTVRYLGLAALTLACAGPGRAATDFFVFGGGSTVRTLRQEQDELLNNHERVNWEGSWEGGVGLRIFPGRNGSGLEIAGPPAWEVRLRGGPIRGDLKNTRVVFSRQSPPIYTATSTEKFNYSGWGISATLVTRVFSWVGLFAGPGIQSIKLKGELNRVWEGEVPTEICPDCGSRTGKNDASVLYRVLEVGARLTPGPTPVGVELFWVPNRVRMSTTETVGADDYQPNFAELKGAWGLRFTYDF
jgi:hypothetical protein